MAYATSNPPRPILSFPYSDGSSDLAKTFWAYIDGDAAATVRVSGYITDANKLGMKDGDLLFHYDTGNKIWNTYTVLISGTTYDLSDATVVGSSTDSD